MNNPKKHLADSKIMLEIEQIVLQKFSKKAVKKRLYFGKNQKIELDGYLEKPRTFIEIWSRIGEPRSAQKTKICADAFKLLFAEKIFGQAKKVLLFVDRETMKHFFGKSWHAQALKNFGFELKLIKINDDLRNRILEAQTKMANGNRKND